MDRTAELKAKIERLQKKKTALLTQSRLLQDFVSLAKSSAKEQMLTAVMQKTLELTAELTKAETGSLFLLDPDGVVRDCILTRGPRQAKERLDLTATVLEGGIAGWVTRPRAPSTCRVSEIGCRRNTTTMVPQPSSTGYFRERHFCAVRQQVKTSTSR